MHPVAYKGIASSPHLEPNTGDDAGRIPYRYDAQADWGHYGRIIVEPVEIYRGPDSQFADMSEEDKAVLASYMRAQFLQKLRRRFKVVADPAPDTLRLKLTLTGATANTPVLSPLSHLDVAGNLYNGMQAIRDGEGVSSGSVIYAVEISDASTGRLLSAYVTKQYPNAMDLTASFGSLAASKTGIEKGADMLVAQLR
jgi:hypothetical protein